ncbi:carbonic anhydrase [Sphingobium estronivorans]|uniref:carbonic anhydrase n=1 Tax=Sphingobium estronivorans TaxID=1577690 RepID=UPI0012399A7A|nr:carbonic anhydrase [Sphingobium estronivorans]
MRERDKDGVVATEWNIADLPSLFERNRAWADAKTHSDPTFFSRLVGQQRPRYFWIGCSDSRVPATEIVDLDPGEMFVHRNVANLAIADDPNFAAALQFAVEILEVEHIMVVGHYGCGGIHAAMTAETDGAIGHWLAPIREIYQSRPCQDNEPGATDPNDLCDRNVRAQVDALTANPIVCQAWERSKRLTLHGWVYSIGDGRLKTVCKPVDSPLAPGNGQ